MVDLLQHVCRVSDTVVGQSWDREGILLVSNCIQGRRIRHCQLGINSRLDVVHICAGADNVGKFFRMKGMRVFSFDHCCLVCNWHLQ